MSELKPCPFCGGTTIPFITDGDVPLVGYLQCMGCGASNQLHSSKSLQIAKWNRRRVESELAAIAERDRVGMREMQAKFIKASQELEAAKSKIADIESMQCNQCALRTSMQGEIARLRETIAKMVKGVGGTVPEGFVKGE